MRWVKETLPPRLRARWLLMTIRLSMSSLAGSDRTLVAVGISRLASMLLTTRAVAPRSRVTVASFCGPVDRGAGASRGVGAPPDTCGSAEVVLGFGLGVGAVVVPAFFVSGCFAP